MSDQALIAAFLASKGATVCPTGEAAAKAPKPDVMAFSAVKGISRAEAHTRLSDTLTKVFERALLAIVQETEELDIWDFHGIKEAQYNALESYAQNILIDLKASKELKAYETRIRLACKLTDSEEKELTTVCKAISSKKLMAEVCRTYSHSGPDFSIVLSSFTRGLDSSIAEYLIDWSSKIAIHFNLVLQRYLKAFDNA